MQVNRLRRFLIQCPPKDVEARWSGLGSLCETMRTHIASIVLAATVLTVASLLAPFARAATNPLMPTTGTPFDPNPAAPGSPTNQFMKVWCRLGPIGKGRNGQSGLFFVGLLFHNRKVVDKAVHKD
jgi:hypothetical protein